MAGLFFVFSFSVMAALGRLPAAEGMRAMQQINRTILNPVFLSAFFGTAIVCAIVVMISAWQRPPQYGWAIVGAGVYLAGGFLVTAACNVPLNNALDQLSPDTPEGEAEWGRYQKRWTSWNHLRTVSCITASVCLAISLI